MHFAARTRREGGGNENYDNLKMWFCKISWLGDFQKHFISFWQVLSGGRHLNVADMGILTRLYFPGIAFQLMCCILPLLPFVVVVVGGGVDVLLATAIEMRQH